MAYDILYAHHDSLLQEAARVAYGSGGRERTAGGKGNMGVLKDADGNLRIVKFSTHWKERTSRSPATAQMVESSNRLRTMLLGVAKSAGVVDLRAIRSQLGLSAAGTETGSDKLLSRSAVAAVVRLIGGENVWNDALKGVDMAAYESKADTHFDLVAKRLQDRKIIQPGKAFEVLSEQEVRDCRDAALDKVSTVCREGVPDTALGHEVIFDTNDRARVKSLLRGIVTEEFIRRHAVGGACTKANVIGFPARLERFVRALPVAYPQIDWAAGYGGEAEKVLAFLREGCRQAMDNGRALFECGLDAAQVARLNECHLMPYDCIAVVKDCFPGLNGDELWQVAKSVSVYAAKDLADSPDNLSDIQEHLQKGDYKGLVFGALFAAARPGDLDRHLQELVRTNGAARFGTCEERNPSEFASRAMAIYRNAKGVLYAKNVYGEVDAAASWRSFSKTIAFNGFELLRSSGNESPCDALARVGNLIEGLDPDDVAKCRDKGVDAVRVLAKVGNGNALANGHLLAKFVAKMPNRDLSDADGLAAKIDEFWTKVTPSSVLNEELVTETEKTVFQLVASCVPDAYSYVFGEHSSSSLSCEKALRYDCRARYREVMYAIRHVVKTVNDEGASKITREDVLASFTGPTAVRNLRSLMKRIEDGNVVSHAEDMAQKFVDVRKKVEGYVKDLQKRYLRGDADAKAVKEVFAGAVNGRFRSLLVDDLFVYGYTGFKKFADEIENGKMKDLVEEYIVKFGKKMDGATIRENRARRMASFAVIKCVLNAKQGLFSKGEHLTAIYGHMRALCDGKNGVVDQIDACMKVLRGTGADKEKKQAIANLGRNLAKALYAECWDPDVDYRPGEYSLAEVYDTYELEYGVKIGEDEIAALLHSSLFALLRVDQEVAEAILSTMGDSPLDEDPSADPETRKLMSTVQSVLKELRDDLGSFESAQEVVQEEVVDTIEKAPEKKMGADIEDEVAVESDDKAEDGEEVSDEEVDSDDKAEDGEEMSDEEFDRYLEGCYGLVKDEEKL